MDLKQLENALLREARQKAADQRVPLAFEKRVMAALRASPVLDHWEQWSQALWRAAAPCLGVAALIVAWAVMDMSGKRGSADLSQEFENTVLAAVQAEAHAE